MSPGASLCRAEQERGPALRPVLIGSGHTAGAYQGRLRWTIPFTVLALILAVIMRGKPLSEEMADIAAGKAEAPEY